MSFLFVEFDTTGDDFVNWLLCDSNRREVARGASDIQTMCEDLEREYDVNANNLVTVGIVPDTDLLLAEVDIPGKNRNRIRRAAKFAIEPYLTEDVRDMHTVVDIDAKGTLHRCVAIRRSTLDRYLAIFDGLSWNVDSCLSPGLTADPERNELAVIETRNGISLRTYAEMAQTSRELAASVVPSLLEGLNEENRRLSCVSVDAEWSRGVAELFQTGEIQTDFVSADVLGFVAERFDGNAPLNLLQGDYERHRTIKGSGKAWNGVGVVGLLAMFVSTGLLYGQGLWSSSEVERIRSAQSELFERIYGESIGYGQPATTMRNRMGQVTGSSVFETLLSEVGDTVQRLDIQNIAFEAARNTLSLTIFARSFDDLEQFKRALEERTLTVEIVAAEQRDDRVRSDVVVVGS